MRKIILCADDFGFNSAVSNGITRLVENQRLSAVSCMTNMPDWQASAALLKPFQHKIDIGLHFNLTDGFSLASEKKFDPICRVVLSAYTGKLKKAFVVEELKKQLNAFSETLGFAPAFIDGHQHVQQLPVVRNALVETCLKIFPNRKIYIRVSSNGWIHAIQHAYKNPKILFIHCLGADKLKNMLIDSGIPHNTAFSGIYDFSAAKDYRRHFLGFLRRIKETGLIMCHPGFPASQALDPIHQARLFEYHYFSSDQFSEDQENFQFQLVRFQNP